MNREPRTWPAGFPDRAPASHPDTSGLSPGLRRDVGSQAQGRGSSPMMAEQATAPSGQCSHFPKLLVPCRMAKVGRQRIKVLTFAALHGLSSRSPLLSSAVCSVSPRVTLG